jgi:hypothetical protein
MKALYVTVSAMFAGLLRFARNDGKTELQGGDGSAVLPDIGYNDHAQRRI